MQSIRLLKAYMQFYSLSKLVTDIAIQVREQSMAKLLKGLGRGIPHKCLLLDFMGMYVMAGMEADKRLRNTTKTYMLNDINFKRKEFLSDARIPVMYFKPHEDPAFQNLVSYTYPEAATLPAKEGGRVHRWCDGAAHVHGQWSDRPGQ